MMPSCPGRSGNWARNLRSASSKESARISDYTGTVRKIVTDDKTEVLGIVGTFKDLMEIGVGFPSHDFFTKRVF